MVRSRGDSGEHNVRLESCSVQTTVPTSRTLDFGQFDFGHQTELAEVEIGRSRTDGVCSVFSFSLLFFLLLCLFTFLYFFPCSNFSLSLFI